MVKPYEYKTAKRRVKTMKKRCYALLLAIMLVFGTVLPETALTAVSVEAAAYSYNPNAAIAYAEKYWTNYNDAYPNYNIFGGDCADFVSQSLHAGGLQMNANWYHAPADIVRNITWTYASSLKSYLEKYCGKAVTIYKDSSKNTGYRDSNKKEIDPKTTIRPGDAVFYYWKGGSRYGHAAICVGYDSKGEPIVNAHNSDRHHLNWTLNAYKNADHWCVIQINSTQDQSSLKEVPADARSYTGELWKIGGANLYMYEEPSTDAQKLKTASGSDYKAVRYVPVAVSEKTTVGNDLWGKITYNRRSGWVILRSSSKTYAKKIADGSGAIVDPTPTPAPAETKLTSIALSETNILLTKNATCAVSVKSCKPSNAANKSVTWTSSNTAVATVSANGTIRGVQQGTATITATANDGSNVRAVCKVTVGTTLYKITASSVKLRKTASGSAKSLATIKKNKTITVTSFKYNGNKQWGRTTYNKKTGWVLLKNGKTYAKPVSSDSNTGSGVKVTKITLNKKSAVVRKKKTVRLSVKKYAPSKPTTKGVTWKSSNTKIAKVSSSGKVTGIKKGTVTITATAKDGSNVKATCKIKVK